MIRINLLPTRKEAEREASKRQLIVFVAILLLLCAGFYPVWATKASEVDDMQATVAKKRNEINTLKAKVKDIETLKRNKEALEKQINVLNELEAGRSGPVRVLDEMQTLLTAPQNELDKITFEKRGWNSRWDPSRLWINSLRENGGKFTMDGGARTADDVAEFLLRMSSSVYFSDVKLLSSTHVDATGFSYVKYNVSGQIVYATPKAPPKKG